MVLFVEVRRRLRWVWQTLRIELILHEYIVAIHVRQNFIKLTHQPFDERFGGHYVRRPRVT